jgi:serine protease Do/serine protease DegQ
VEGSALFGQVEGIVVSGVAASSPAWRAGLRKGDVIVSANRKAVHNLVEFKQAIQGNDSLLLNVRRGKGALFLYLQ